MIWFCLVFPFGACARQPVMFRVVDVCRLRATYSVWAGLNWTTDHSGSVHKQRWLLLVKRLKTVSFKDTRLLTFTQI